MSDRSVTRPRGRNVPALSRPGARPPFPVARTLLFRAEVLCLAAGIAAFLYAWLAF